MYIELVIAAMAGIAWSATAPGQWNDLCFNIVVMASATTLLFNANPLMRFDGYYILSDILDLPNLYSDGQQSLKYVGRRYLLGEKIRSSLGLSAADLFIRLYAVLAFLWRIVICVSLLLAASMMFIGFGIVLTAAASPTSCDPANVAWSGSTKAVNRSATS